MHGRFPLGYQVPDTRVPMLLTLSLSSFQNNKMCYFGQNLSAGQNLREFF